MFVTKELYVGNNKRLNLDALDQAKITGLQAPPGMPGYSETEYTCKHEGHSFTIIQYRHHVGTEVANINIDASGFSNKSQLIKFYRLIKSLTVSSY